MNKWYFTLQTNLNNWLSIIFFKISEMFSLRNTYLTAKAVCKSIYNLYCMNGYDKA